MQVFVIHIVFVDLTRRIKAEMLFSLVILGLLRKKETVKVLLKMELVTILFDYVNMLEVQI